MKKRHQSPLIPVLIAIIALHVFITEINADNANLNKLKKNTNETSLKNIDNQQYTVIKSDTVYSNNDSYTPPTIKAFPVPASEIINYTIENSIFTLNTIEFIKYNGELISTIIIEKSDENSGNIDVDNYDEGRYIMLFKFSNERIHYKEIFIAK